MITTNIINKMDNILNMDKYKCKLASIVNAAFEEAELNSQKLISNPNYFSNYILKRTELIVKTVNLIVEQQKIDIAVGTEPVVTQPPSPNAPQTGQAL